jgi:DnaJ family protein B protein 12
VRVHTFGGGRPRRQQPQHGGAPQQDSSFLYQLLPILFLLIITIVPTLLATSTPPAPSFVFEVAKPPLTLQRLTPQHSIPYFVDPAQVSGLSNSKLRQLDQKAELVYIRGLRDQCQHEYDNRQQRMMDAHAWWGTVKDKEAYERARTMQLSSCDRLRGMGYRTEIY